METPKWTRSCSIQLEMAARNCLPIDCPPGARHPRVYIRTLDSLAPTGFILDRLQLQADLLSGAKQRVGRLPGHVRAPDFVRRWPVTRPRNAESCARARADLATYGGGFGSTSLRLIERRVRALPGARARRTGAAPSGGFAQALRRRWFAGKRLWVRAPRGRGARGRRFYDVYG